MYVIWMACSLITRVASGRISSETHAPVELRRSPSLGSLSPKVRAFASSCDSMSEHSFEAILAVVVATVLVWIFWRKGKSD